MGKSSQFISKIVGSKQRVIFWIAFGLFLYLIIYFSYQGITTSPSTPGHDIDSITYHIPIAKNFASGRLLPLDLKHGLGYYPSVGEAILAVFIILGIPLNLFNVLGLVLLFIISKKLAQNFGLNNSYLIVFAVSVVSLNSVNRLVNNQTIDIWLAIFFLLSLSLLQNPKKSVSYFLKLGISIGFLIGVKYSGILFVGVLALFYYKKVFKYINLKRVLALSIPIIILGFSWYLRNYALTGNPIYPGGLFGLEKHPDFMVQNWYPITSILRNPPFIVKLFTTLVSEYLIWVAALILPIFVIYLDKIRKISIDKNIKLLSFLGVSNFAVFFFLPSNPGAVVSDVRYLFPSFIPLILAAFLLAKRFNKLKELSIIALLSSFLVIAQFAYRPKIVFAWLLLISGLLFVKNRVISKEL